MNSLAPKRCDSNSIKEEFSRSLYGIVAWALYEMLLADECCGTSLMRSQHLARWWLGDVRKQTTTRANVKPDLCHHKASLSHTELSIIITHHPKRLDSGFLCYQSVTASSSKNDKHEWLSFDTRYIIWKNHFMSEHFAHSPGAKMGTWKCLRVQGFMIDPDSIGILKEIKLGCHDGNLGELFYVHNS